MSSHSCLGFVTSLLLLHLCYITSLIGQNQLAFSFVPKLYLTRRRCFHVNSVVWFNLKEYFALDWKLPFENQYRYFWFSYSYFRTKYLWNIVDQEEYLYGAESCLRSRQSLSYSKIFQNVMEPEGSLPCSHEPSTGFHLEPYESSPQHSIPFLSYLF
jgi:hypothetical protein